MNTNIYTHPSFIKHETPQNHPESPERLKILLEALSAHTIIETNDYDENKRLSDNGITRSVFRLPSEKADTVLPILDRAAEIMLKVNT